MPLRKTPLIQGEYYHIFNRGVAKQPIFHNPRHYQHFLQTISFYQYQQATLKLSYFLRLDQAQKQEYMRKIAHQPRYISVVTYCLMPNHYHLLLRQESEDGVSQSLRLISNSYTRYFNTLEQRVGPLFQGPFKAVHVEDDSQLLHLSRYIHRNPLEARMISAQELAGYVWSSMAAFLGGGSVIQEMDTSIILEHFAYANDYREYVFDSGDNTDLTSRYNHLLLDQD